MTEPVFVLKKMDLLRRTVEGLRVLAAYQIRRCLFCGQLFRDQTKNKSGKHCSKACNNARRNAMRPRVGSPPTTEPEATP